MNVLAGVFNPIAYDGRVERASEALTAVADVSVVCPQGPVLDPAPPFRVLPVRLPRIPFVLTYIYFCCAFVRIALRNQPDVIHAHDYYMAAPGLLASRLTGARLIYDAHELIIPERGGRASSLLRLFALLERIVVPRADLVIAANAERATYMSSYYSMARQPIVVRNIPDEPAYRPPSEGAAFSPAQGDYGDSYVLVYQGIILLRRGLERILDALVLLPVEFQLEIVGGGPDEERLAEEIASRDLSGRVRQRGRVPREALHGLLLQCDAGVLTYSYESLNDRFCAPNKIFEYAQAALPILATDQEPLRRMVQGYGIGKLIASDDGPLEIATAIQELSTAPVATYRAALAKFLDDHRWADEAERLSSAVAELGVRRGV